MGFLEGTGNALKALWNNKNTILSAAANTHSLFNAGSETELNQDYVSKLSRKADQESLMNSKGLTVTEAERELRKNERDEKEYGKNREEEEKRMEIETELKRQDLLDRETSRHLLELGRRTEQTEKLAEIGIKDQNSKFHHQQVLKPYEITDITNQRQTQLQAYLAEMDHTLGVKKLVEGNTHQLEMQKHALIAEAERMKHEQTVKRMAAEVELLKETLYRQNTFEANQLKLHSQERDAQLRSLQVEADLVSQNERSAHEMRLNAQTAANASHQMEVENKFKLERHYLEDQITRLRLESERQQSSEVNQLQGHEKNMRFEIDKREQELRQFQSNQSNMLQHDLSSMQHEQAQTRVRGEQILSQQQNLLKQDAQYRETQHKELENQYSFLKLKEENAARQKDTALQQKFQLELQSVQTQLEREKMIAQQSQETMKRQFELVQLQFDNQLKKQQQSIDEKLRQSDQKHESSILEKRLEHESQLKQLESQVNMHKEESEAYKHELSKQVDVYTRGLQGEETQAKINADFIRDQLKIDAERYGIQQVNATQQQKYSQDFEGAKLQAMLKKEHDAQMQTTQQYDAETRKLIQIQQIENDKYKFELSQRNQKDREERLESAREKALNAQKESIITTQNRISSQSDNFQKQMQRNQDYLNENHRIIDNHEIQRIQSEQQQLYDRLQSLEMQNMELLRTQQLTNQQLQNSRVQSLENNPSRHINKAGRGYAEVQQFDPLEYDHQKAYSDSLFTQNYDTKANDERRRQSILNSSKAQNYQQIKQEQITQNSDYPYQPHITVPYSKTNAGFAQTTQFNPYPPRFNEGIQNPQETMQNQYLLDQVPFEQAAPLYGQSRVQQQQFNPLAPTKAPRKPRTTKPKTDKTLGQQIIPPIS